MDNRKQNLTSLHRAVNEFEKVNERKNMRFCLEVLDHIQLSFDVHIAVKRIIQEVFNDPEIENPVKVSLTQMQLLLQKFEANGKIDSDALVAWHDEYLLRKPEEIKIAQTLYEGSKWADDVSWEWLQLNSPQGLEDSYIQLEALQKTYTIKPHG